MNTDAEHDEAPPNGLVRMMIESTTEVTIVSINGGSIAIPNAAVALVAETLSKFDSLGPARGMMAFEFVPAMEPEASE